MSRSTFSMYFMRHNSSGASLATMQPHRVECLVIDWVISSTDYYPGDWLRTSRTKSTRLIRENRVLKAALQEYPIAEA